jgi:hypothetical protein
MRIFIDLAYNKIISITLFQFTMKIYVIYNLLHHGQVHITSRTDISKYIWTNHLSKNNKGCALVGTKTSNDDNNKSNNTTSNRIVLRSSVHVISMVRILQNSCINPNILNILVPKTPTLQH